MSRTAIENRLMEMIAPDLSAQETSITVGLCVKNSERTIERCLESMLNQRYPKNLIKIIIVDGKSKDNTIRIARKMISLAGAHAEFYSDEEKGLGFARQKVLDNATTKYVIWIDGDAVISKKFLQAQIGFMERNPKVGLAPGMYSFRQNIRIALPALLHSLARLVNSAQYKETQKHGVPPHDACIYRVEALRHAGGFDTRIRGAAEDEDIFMRIRKSGWQILVNPKAKFFTFPRQTWHEIWNESSWFGYGKHYLGHKYEDLHVCMHEIPLVHFYVGVKESLKAYRLTSQGRAFLLPLSYVFSAIAWWVGFMKADFEGYGHHQT